VEIALGFVAIAVAIALYFLGRWHGKQDREQEKSEARRVHEERQRAARVEQVAEKYIALAYGHPPQASGALALIWAGVRDLRDDREIREACDLVHSRRGAHPLGRDGARLKHADLRAFFASLKESRFDLPNYGEVLTRFAKEERC
jgi:hypothetical protein